MRLAKCCRPVPGDTIAGYVSLGRGITIHRADCKNVKALMKSPERFVEVAWEGGNESSYRVELQIDEYAGAPVTAEQRPEPDGGEDPGGRAP